MKAHSNKQSLQPEDFQPSPHTGAPRLASETWVFLSGSSGPSPRTQTKAHPTPRQRGRNHPARPPARHALTLLAAALLCAPTHAQTFTVALDAAHGGPETGALLNPQLAEKSWTLGLSVRLRSALAARGMRVVTTRETDTNPTPETRASAANHARADACLVLHATASGSGAHLYTSSLTPVALQASLQNWSTAQAPFLTRSLQLASEISTAFGGAAIPVTLGRVRLQPLDSLACPAVAVEIAPLHDTRAGKQEDARIDDPAYEQRILDALAAALLAWRGEREPAPGARK